MSEADSKVVYAEGDKVRAIVGEVRQAKDDPDFFEVIRPGGRILINKRFVFFVAPARWDDDRGART